jgi:hypothetical protein
MARVCRRYRSTTASDHSEPIAPNLLNRRFGLEEVTNLTPALP